MSSNTHIGSTIYKWSIYALAKGIRNKHSPHLVSIGRTEAALSSSLPSFVRRSCPVCVPHHHQHKKMDTHLDEIFKLRVRQRHDITRMELGEFH